MLNAMMMQILGTLLSWLRWLGYGVCHQIPARTYFLAGRPLPLCARCSGIYLGALVGLASILILRRARCSELPPTRVLAVLVSFIAFMAVDGFNSYLSFFPGAPQLYPPQNVLRLLTGTLHGLALSLILFPVFSFTFWHTPERQPMVRSLRELGILVLIALLPVFLLETRADFLLYPIAIAEGLGLLAMFSLLNSTALLMVTRRGGRATEGRAAIFPLAIGLFMSLIEINLLGVLRLWLTAQLGLPF